MLRACLDKVDKPQDAEDYGGDVRSACRSVSCIELRYSTRLQLIVPLQIECLLSDWTATLFQQMRFYTQDDNIREARREASQLTLEILIHVSACTTCLRRLKSSDLVLNVC